MNAFVCTEKSIYIVKWTLHNFKFIKKKKKSKKNKYS